jgi:fibronectin-binding autotransporter adhesin
MRSQFVILRWTLGTFVAGVLSIFTTPVTQAQVNSWTNNIGGKWETVGAWSLGTVPSINQSSTFITNGFFTGFSLKDVVIDSTTVASAPGSLIISNLVLSAPKVFGEGPVHQGFNVLIISNTYNAFTGGEYGALGVQNTVTVSTGGAITIINSELGVSATNCICTQTNDQLAVDGSVVLESGNINLSGEFGQIAEAIGVNFSGTLTVAGGGNFIDDGGLAVGQNAGSTGTVWITGGELAVTYNQYNDGDTYLGLYGTGSLVQSNGTYFSYAEFIGNNPGSQGTLTVAGGSHEIGAGLYIGSESGGAGTMWVTGGTVSDTASTTFNFASLTQSNGVMELIELADYGTMTLAGGIQLIGDNGIVIESNGIVWVTGGQLIANNLDSYTEIGAGSLVESNGTVELFGETVGDEGVGTLTVAGGTHSVGFGGLNIGQGGQEVYYSAGTGTVWITGGQLLVTLFSSYIEIGVPSDLGGGGKGSLVQSNGNVEAFGEVVGMGGGGDGASSDGELIVAAGTHLVDEGGLVIASAASTKGSVTLAGGQLIVTNGETDVGLGGVGTMTVSNGTWLAEGVFVGGEGGGDATLTVAGGMSSVYSNFTIGNSDCTGTGTVIVTGGNLFVTNVDHDAVLDLESGKLLLSGGTLVVDQMISTNPCGTLQQTGGTLVIGGVTNTPASFQITSILVEGTNVFIAWTGKAGQTNVVQATNGNGGNYATNYTDLSSPIILTGSGNVTTNYLDGGGATNQPSRYYRVRLAQ